MSATITKQDFASWAKLISDDNHNHKVDVDEFFRAREQIIEKLNTNAADQSLLDVRNAGFYYSHWQYCEEFFANPQHESLNLSTLWMNRPPILFQKRQEVADLQYTDAIADSACAYVGIDRIRVNICAPDYLWQQSAVNLNDKENIGYIKSPKEIANALSGMPQPVLTLVRMAMVNPVHEIGSPAYMSTTNAGALTFYPGYQHAEDWGYHPFAAQEAVNYQMHQTNKKTKIYPPTQKLLRETYFYQESPLHEAGHVWSLQKWGYNLYNSHWTKWQNAQEQDGKFCTEYAMTSAREDFAETFALYCLAKENPTEFGKFREVFSNRFTILDKVWADLEDTNQNDPAVGQTRWQKIGDLYAKSCELSAKIQVQDGELFNQVASKCAKLIDLYEQILELDSDQNSARENISQVYYYLASIIIDYNNSDNTPIYLGYLNKAIKANPSNQQAQLALASFYAQKEQYAKAIAVLETALNHSPKYNLYYESLMTYACMENDYKAAKKYLNRQSAINPEPDAMHEFNSFYINFSLGNYQEALQACQNGYKISNNGAFLKMQYATQCFAGIKVKDSLAKLTQSLFTHNPNDPFEITASQMALYTLHLFNDLTNLNALATDMITFNMEPEQAKMFLICKNYDLNRINETKVMLANYEKNFSATPYNKDLQSKILSLKCLISMDQQKSSDYNNYIQDFNYALELDSQNIYAYLGLVRCYRLSGQFNEAKTMLQKALAFAPQYNPLLVERSFLARQQGPKPDNSCDMTTPEIKSQEEWFLP